jgi:hypothetical protein
VNRFSCLPLQRCSCGCVRAAQRLWLNNILCVTSFVLLTQLSHHFGNMANHRSSLSSPSPAPSLGSDAMSESGPSSPALAPAEIVDDGPMYPLENKFMSATDKAHILSLPEIERESILAERAAESLKRDQDVQLRRALAATQAAVSKHKRKAAAAELDDDGIGVRKSRREKAEKTGRSALDDYKKAREAKGAERTGRLDVKPGKRRDSRSPASASDRDADGESEVEWAAETVRREEPTADLKDFERCRVGRSNFAKVCFYPNFETTMRGCFCRVSIGMNRETGQNMYRMTQIKGKLYRLQAMVFRKKQSADTLQASNPANLINWNYQMARSSPLTNTPLSPMALLRSLGLFRLAQTLSSATMSMRATSTLSLRNAFVLRRKDG